MSKFVFEAMDDNGKRIKGEVDADNAQGAIAKLKTKHLKPINIKEKKTEGKSAGAEASSANTMTKTVTGKVKTKDLTQFTLQLSVLQDAGLPITRSLKILAKQMNVGMMKNIVTQVADDVETGNSLSESLAKHPKAFDKLYVNMIRAGEAGGIQETILQRLSHFLEKAAELKRKIIGALIYPLVVMFIALSVVTAIMIFIVPKFKEIFESQNMKLPGMTQFLIDFSNFITNFWYLLIFLPFAIVFLMKLYGRTDSGRYTLDKLKFKIPIFGVIIRKALISRFCRTLGTLIQSGVPILDSLSIVKAASGNEVLSRATEHVHASIREGESIAGPLEQSKIFDDMVINMIEVGEETGELDRMLLKIADNYEGEVDSAVENLMNVLEPLLIVSLGAIVGFIVVALFMPLVNIMKAVSKKG